MSASNDFETAILQLIFQNVAIANVGDTSGIQPSASAGDLYVGLHTADPGEAGNQSTNEANYTGYARVGVARSSAGWTVSGNTVTNAAEVDFPAATGGSSTVSYFSIGTGSSGAGTLLFSGALQSSLAISSSITPSFGIGELAVSAD